MIACWRFFQLKLLLGGKCHDTPTFWHKKRAETFFCCIYWPGKRLAVYAQFEVNHSYMHGITLTIKPLYLTDHPPSIIFKKRICRFMHRCAACPAKSKLDVGFAVFRRQKPKSTCFSETVSACFLYTNDIVGVFTSFSGKHTEYNCN